MIAIASGPRLSGKSSDVCLAKFDQHFKIQNGQRRIKTEKQDCQEEKNQMFKKWANPGLFFVYFRSFHIPIQMTNRYIIRSL